MVQPYLYGHDYGDQLLAQIADRLCQYLYDVVMYHSFNQKTVNEKYPCIFRFGGDEFVVLVTAESAGDNEKSVVERLEENIRDKNKKENRNYDICLSMGLVHYDKESKPSIDELISKADRLMYEQKKRKKNQENPKGY